ncbi:MAG: hypothetical protein U5L45_19595 [Saprospiraceae bacterium]|nr:hypothetical protein [Saprospiraceae bacterium]
MEKQKVFRDCSLYWLEKTFDLEETKHLPSLDKWLSQTIEISQLERDYFLILQEDLDFNYRSWNEEELAQYFIGPILSLVRFSSKKFNLFAERPIEGIVQDWRLFGKPDGILASGRRVPEIPFFSFQEYKKMTDPDGDPAGQALAAMLVGQSLNGGGETMYGCHIIGGDWYFMTLDGNKFSISRSYSALSDELFAIFKALKVLKNIIIERISTKNDLST